MNYLKHQAHQLRLEARSQPGQDRRPRRDRAAPGRGPGRQEPDHPGQSAAGRLDRQAARRALEQLLRAGLRRQHVADPRRREVRLLARQQVQHVRLLGDHEELRPDDPRGELSPRPVRHRPRGDVRGRRRQPDRRARVRERPQADAGGGQGDARPARRPRAARSSSAGSAWAAPASRPSSSSAASWGSPRNASARSSPAPRTSSARSPARRSSTCRCSDPFRSRVGRNDPPEPPSHRREGATDRASRRFLSVPRSSNREAKRARRDILRKMTRCCRIESVASPVSCIPRWLAMATATERLDPAALQRSARDPGRPAATPGEHPGPSRPPPSPARHGHRGGRHPQQREPVPHGPLRAGRRHPGGEARGMGRIGDRDLDRLASSGISSAHAGSARCWDRMACCGWSPA